VQAAEMQESPDNQILAGLVLLASKTMLNRHSNINDSMATALEVRFHFLSAKFSVDMRCRHKEVLALATRGKLDHRDPFYLKENSRFVEFYCENDKSKTSRKLDM
jgi:hypothetical protein